MSEIIFYKTEDGRDRIDLRLENNSVWLSLNQLAILFARNKSVISRHITNILEDEEVQYDSVVVKYIHVQECE